MINEQETKEVAVVERNASKILDAANAITIASDADLAAATDQLSVIKKLGKELKERKEAITKPLNEALASARDLFRKPETVLSDAERIFKRKMLDYQTEQDRKADEERARLAARVERGTMKPTTAMSKMSDISGATTSMQGKVGSIKTMTLKKYRIVDETKIPREYLVPDMRAIADAFKAGVQVPGAEEYEEKVIAAR